MNERTIEQTTETMPLASKTITAANIEENNKLTRAATPLKMDIVGENVTWQNRDES